MYEENYFHTFTSHKYFKIKRHDLFLGIKQNGRCKSPKLTYPGQISVQFLLLHNNNTDKMRIATPARQSRVKQGKRDMGQQQSTDRRNCDFYMGIKEPFCAAGTKKPLLLSLFQLPKESLSFPGLKNLSVWQIRRQYRTFFWCSDSLAIERKRQTDLICVIYGKVYI